MFVCAWAGSSFLGAEVLEFLVLVRGVGGV